jgi:hypothetical protein
LLRLSDSTGSEWENRSSLVYRSASLAYRLHPAMPVPTTFPYIGKKKKRKAHTPPGVSLSGCKPWLL